MNYLTERQVIMNTPFYRGEVRKLHMKSGKDQLVVVLSDTKYNDSYVTIIPLLKEDCTVEREGCIYVPMVLANGWHELAIVSYMRRCHISDLTEDVITSASKSELNKLQDGVHTLLGFPVDHICNYLTDALTEIRSWCQYVKDGYKTLGEASEHFEIPIYDFIKEGSRLGYNLIIKEDANKMRSLITILLDILPYEKEDVTFRRLFPKVNKEILKYGYLPYGSEDQLRTDIQGYFELSEDHTSFTNPLIDGSLHSKIIFLWTHRFENKYPISRSEIADMLNTTYSSVTYHLTKDGML